MMYTGSAIESCPHYWHFLALVGISDPTFKPGTASNSADPVDHNVLLSQKEPKVTDCTDTSEANRE